LRGTSPLEVFSCFWAFFVFCFHVPPDATMSRRNPKSAQNRQPPNNHQGGGEGHPKNCNVSIRGGVEIDLSQNLGTKHEAEHEERTTHDNKQLFWARLTLWALVAYTFVTILMYCANRKAANAAESAAKTARDGLGITVEQVHVSQRAYLTTYDFSIPEPLQPNHPVRAILTIKNSGPTPATDIHFAFQVFITDRKLVKLTAIGKAPSDSKTPFSTTFLGAQQPNSRPNEAWLDGNRNRLLNSDEFNAINAGTKFLYAVAVIDYLDVFKHQGHTVSCSIYIPDIHALVGCENGSVLE